MNQLVASAIVLARTDYGEADRILTLLTADQGKLRLMAKGVRRVKSKLAGGIELFSVSTITYIRGRGEIGTLVSARLVTYYSNIVHDLDRTMLGYELIKQLNKVTEDEPEPEYFSLLHQAFVALNDSAIAIALIRFWFSVQLLRLGGHTPNLETDTTGDKLQANLSYNFDVGEMSFSVAPEDKGKYRANHIKLLRLAFAGHGPKALQAIDAGPLFDECFMLVQDMKQMHTD